MAHYAESLSSDPFQSEIRTSKQTHRLRSVPGRYWEKRACSRGMSLRSHHRFSHRRPGDVGHEEQESVSWKEWHVQKVCASMGSQTYHWGTLIFSIVFNSLISLSNPPLLGPEFYFKMSLLTELCKKARKDQENTWKLWKKEKTWNCDRVESGQEWKKLEKLLPRGSNKTSWKMNCSIGQEFWVPASVQTSSYLKISFKRQCVNTHWTYSLWISKIFLNEWTLLQVNP